MKKALIIADTYYPDSRATIMIAQRIGEEMVKRGYVVEALPLHLGNKTKISYPASHNGVKILGLNDYIVPKQQKIARYQKLNKFCYSVALAPKKFLVKEPKGFGEKWNEHLMGFVRKTRKEIYEKPAKSIALMEVAERIRSCICETKPDVVVSVAVPFDIHICVSKAIAGQQVKWVATNFDPFAYDEGLEPKARKKNYDLEYRVCKSANAVIMLTQFKEGYVGAKLSDKIRYAELPNIRPIYPAADSTQRFFDPDTINCAFIGNLYGERRNPCFLFDFFAKMSDPKIHLYIIGGLINIEPDEFAKYSQKLNGRLHYLGRVGQQEAINAMFEADVLVNVGHSTSNQCPSKVLDYMCTGKPILHIAKIDNCSSLPYLKKYESWLHLEEKNGVQDEIVNEAEAFILASRGKAPVAFDQVREAFPDSTIEKYVDTIEASL